MTNHFNSISIISIYFLTWLPKIADDHQQLPKIVEDQKTAKDCQRSPNIPDDWWSWQKIAYLKVSKISQKQQKEP